MNSDCNLTKRAQLYQNVVALTGLTLPFVKLLEYNYTNDLKEKAKKEPEKYPPNKIQEMVEREMSKLIEKVNEPNFFSYYATLGVDNIVQARLLKNRDNYFVYQQTKQLLEQLEQTGREGSKDGGIWLQLYIDDIANAYSYFANNDQYRQDKDWKELTYQLKLSLYTRFPELVRKSKNSGDN